MILGLPVETWLLMGVATIPGLAIVIASYRAHRRDRGPDG